MSEMPKEIWAFPLSPDKQSTLIAGHWRTENRDSFATRYIRADHDAALRKELAEVRAIVHQFSDGQRTALVALGLIGNIVLRGEAE